jgi:hypothetical protein
MTDAGETMLDLTRPMQHAVNNLVMVMQANMDSVLASLPPDDRAAVRLTRAAQATKDMEALVRAFLRLGRQEESRPVDSGRFLASVQPVLTLTTGRPVKVDLIATAPVTLRRPAADLALLGAFTRARELPRTTPITVWLEGATLRINWPLPEHSRIALEEAGIRVREEAAETRLLLPATG